MVFAAMRPWDSIATPIVIGTHKTPVPPAGRSRPDLTDPSCTGLCHRQRATLSRHRRLDQHLSSDAGSHRPGRPARIQLHQTLYRLVSPYSGHRLRHRRTRRLHRRNRSTRDFPYFTGRTGRQLGRRFDIIYALQDLEFDRSVGLHSIPARFGVHKSHRHQPIAPPVQYLVRHYRRLVLRRGSLYWIGALFFVGMLLIQHLLATPRRLDRIGPMFGVVNGLTSVGYALCAILDLWFHYHG